MAVKQNFYDALMCRKCGRILPLVDFEGIEYQCCPMCGGGLEGLNIGFFPNAELSETPGELERHFGVV